ncbi:MAG: ABC transporter permease [Cyclobacteriaceae bacterium]
MAASDPKYHKPPRLADKILHWFCNEQLVEEIEGDLDEYYQLYSKRYPSWRAKLYYWFHLFSFLRPYSLKNKRQNSNGLIMFRNHLKFSFRYLSKHRTNSLLNVMSLSIGIACFLFIFIYLNGELSFDTYHKDSDRIHRVAIDFMQNGERIPDATTPPALSPALLENIPEVELATRVFPTWGGKYLIGVSEDRQFYEEQVYRVDPDFLKIFNYNVLLGNPDELLSELSNVVLTESMARKYFGDENPIGKELTIFNRDDRKKIVSGVIEDVPFNSHFTFDFITPLHNANRDINSDWGWYNYYTYVKLHNGSAHADFEEKLQPLYLANNPRDSINPNIIYSQPVEDIHLQSALKWELGTNSNMSNIKVFVSIGIFILLVSLINYLNLTIGGLVRRAKEAGVRKSFGAVRANLVGQFVTESLMVVVISLVIGGVLAEISLIGLTEIFGREISLLDPSNSKAFGILTVCVVAFGVFAGLYPALHFASLGEIKVMLSKRRGGFLDLKRVLLIAQFAISAIMIVGTMVVYQQLMYFKNSDMGFNMDQVLVIENASVVSNQQTLKERVSQLSFVESAGYSNGVVGGLNWTFTLGYPEGFLMNYTVVSPDYMETMEFEFLAGRNFDASIETDREGLNLIANEAALQAMNLALDKVGESVVMSSQSDSLIYGRVLGVVKDFHFSNFKSEIKPYAFFYREGEAQNLAVRMNSTNVLENIEQLEAIWNELAIGVPFESYFLDQSFAKLHRTEERLSEVMLYLTGLSIFISFIGMFAIANIVIKARLKEVAVRKALGATTNQVVNMFTKNFVLLVVIANVIGLPIAYITMQEWLADFSYRTNLGPALFILALILTIGLAYLIVGIRSFRAANADLTERLRDE